MRATSETLTAPQMLADYFPTSLHNDVQNSSFKMKVCTLRNEKSGYQIAINMDDV
jgi:hypothetical protein